MEEGRKSITPGQGCLERNARKSNATASDAKCNSRSLALFPYPSLAELSTIAANCNKTNATTDQVHQEKSCANSSTIHLNGAWTKHHIPATPPKSDLVSPAEIRPVEDPITPTANLKMLVSAASPAIRDREIKKRELFPKGEHHFRAPTPVSLASSCDSFSVSSHRNDSMPASNSERVTVSRKDKSLGLLCLR